MYIPFDVILSFPAPNYENPASRGHGLIVLNVIFTTLLIAAVAGRLYARIYLKRWYVTVSIPIRSSLTYNALAGLDGMMVLSFSLLYVTLRLHRHTGL